MKRFSKNILVDDVRCVPLFLFEAGTPTVRILMVLRLYAGFEDALSTGRPVFSGVPTISNLIRGLDAARHEVRILFARRPGPLRWSERDDKDVSLEGFLARITVLAGEGALPLLPRRLRQRASLWRHIWSAWRAWREFRPDVIYFDRGHVMAAALFARFTRTPVVWRVMGVPESLRPVITWSGPRGWLWRWILRSHFAAVICTLDGSGGGPWLARALAPAVERYELLNGHALPPLKPAPVTLTAGRTIVAFVGRLERLKGAEEFLDAFGRAYANAHGELHAVVVGAGSLELALKKHVEDAGLSDAVTFTGAVDHTTALALVRRAHIYVSLNRMGNLSNANLEAMAAGVCMIVPSSDHTTGVDVDADELLPPDTAFRFGVVDDIGALTNAILYLHRNSDERRARAARIKDVADRIIPTWDQRIACEIEILERVAGSARGCATVTVRSPA